jgi:hypothetical protein
LAVVGGDSEEHVSRCDLELPQGMCVALLTAPGRDDNLWPWPTATNCLLPSWPWLMRRFAVGPNEQAAMPGL